MHLLHVILSVLSAFLHALGFVQVCSLIWQLLAYHLLWQLQCSLACCSVLQPVLTVSTSLRCQLRLFEQWILCRRQLERANAEEEQIAGEALQQVQTERQRDQDTNFQLLLQADEIKVTPTTILCLD